jgi:selenium metabolism protein YedF
METLDCTGLNCPEPVLRAKAQLEQAHLKPFSVIVDNEASRGNVLRFGRSQGCDVGFEKGKNDTFRITLIPGKNSGKTGTFNDDDYLCELPGNGDLVYVISSNTMGRGSDDLGWALLQTYVTTIAEVSPLPSHILIYNSGVKLVTTDGKALDALLDLEKKNVIIWVCGTCLEFFKLEKERKVGSITNMYDIMNTMASASRLVSPF